jgi:hypothetical protein
MVPAGTPSHSSADFTCSIRRYTRSARDAKGEGKVIAIKVDQAFAESMFAFERLDRIGPARFVPADQLEQLNEAIISIKPILVAARR